MINLRINIFVHWIKDRTKVVSGIFLPWTSWSKVIVTSEQLMESWKYICLKVTLNLLLAPLEPEENFSMLCTQEDHTVLSKMKLTHCPLLASHSGLQIPISYHGSKDESRVALHVSSRDDVSWKNIYFESSNFEPWNHHQSAESWL